MFVFINIRLLPQILETDQQHQKPISPRAANTTINTWLNLAKLDEANENSVASGTAQINR
ncbi:unnamed protein product [Clonostachys rosea f. rosea IK726]|uniref:Uncharacterized protein n=1 Tax=Clonostachys rosea f. rosea IK726 TaxID=1349383 RepID=A0ACA9TD05_BIOOC|nr:unnamed protein product [Clonostachys rosea f. rosea IK726]